MHWVALVFVTLITVPFCIFTLRFPEEAAFLFERWKYKEDPHLSELGRIAIQAGAWIGIGMTGILWLVVIAEISRTN